MVGSLVVHTPILSLHLHEYSNVVSKSEENASALIFFFNFITMRFALYLPNMQKVDKKEGEIEGGIGVLIFCHSFT